MFQKLLKRIARELDRIKIPYMVIGGQAVLIYGEPRLTKDIDISSRDLALRKPHLAKAEAVVKSARTDLERARVDLVRTVIRAPFNLIIREENIDLGSEVSTATNLAVLAATDIFWAEISVPTEKLAWFELPDSAKSGSPVLIHTRQKQPHVGKIISLAGKSISGTPNMPIKYTGMINLPINDLKRKVYGRQTNLMCSFSRRGVTWLPE